MIPAKRLLLYVTCLVPLGLLPAINSDLLVISGILLFCATLPVLVDLLLTRQWLNPVEISTPALIRFSCQRQGMLPVTLSCEGTGPAQILLAIDLPSSMAAGEEIVTVPLVKGGALVQFELPITPGTRGSFAIKLAMIACNSRLGFWEMRQSRPLATEIRVYPDLQVERKTMAALFYPKSAIGIHNRRQVGQGREFEKLREYLPGDSLDMIHWKATAKRNVPMSKVYQIERVQEVYTIIDSARLSGQPVSGPLSEERLESYIRASLVMGMATRKQGDKFGLLTFSHKIDTFLRAKAGKVHFNDCRDTLYTLKTQRVTPDFRELAVFIRQRLKKRALLIIMTSLDDPILAEELMKSLELITRHHLVMVMVMAPATARPLFSHADVASRDDIRRRMIGNMQDQNLKTLEQKLRRRGVSLIRCQGTNLSLQMVQHYMSVKARQVL
jgi:uncharacterized protein (DUF58 family)